MRHAVLLGLLGLVQPEAQEEQRERRDDAESQTDAPVGFQALDVVAEDPQKHERDKGADHEAEVDHQVGEEDEPPVARALLDLARGLGGRDGAGGVLATDADACGVLERGGGGPRREGADAPRKKRQMVSIRKMPWGPLPYEPVHSVAKTIRMTAEAVMANLRE